MGRQPECGMGQEGSADVPGSLAATSSTHVRGVLTSATIAAVWTVLAVRNPSLTYHFAPLLAAIAWPLVLRSRGPVPRRAAAAGAIGGLLLVVLVGVGLHLAGRLGGPTFWDDGPAVNEVLVFAVVGAALGFRIATRARPGLLGRIVEG